MFKDLFRRVTGVRDHGDSQPNPQPLLRAMEAIARKDNVENREVLYQAFLKSWLLFCVPELPDGWKPGMTVIPAGMNISVSTANNSKGERILPVFTDTEALANYDPNTPNLAFSAIEVFKMAVKIDVAQIVVNPFDPRRKQIRAGGVLTRPEFTALAAGMVPSRSLADGGLTLTVQRPTQIQIGRNRAPVNPEMARRMCTAAAGFPEITKIFRYRMRIVDTGAESEVFGIDSEVKVDRFHEITGTLMTLLKPYIKEGEYIDFTKLKPSDQRLMQAQGELIYDKSTMG